jgi:hypothetical protein
MAEITQASGRTIINYMARDYDTLLQIMRQQIPCKLPEWTDAESEADFGNVLLQLFAHMGDILNYYQDRIANESFLGTAQTRRSVIQHLRLIGYRLGTAMPAAATLRLAVPASCSEVITITKGHAFATKSRAGARTVRFEYTRAAPLTIDCAALAVDAGTGKKQFDGIPVEEGRLIQNEVLGVSDGTPDQTYRLAHARMILKAFGQGQRIHQDIVLVTELGNEIVSWTLQESLAFSRAGQNDFTLEIDEEDRATLRFGDGSFGAVPPSGCVIRATYRVGGGSHGNVAAAAIQTIVEAPQLALLGATVSNPEPATGGADRESIERAVRHAPTVFRALKRAVTAADYRALALDFKGVGKVRPEAAGWNSVKLFVAPAGGGHVSDVLKANLLAYFEDKRPISTVIEIEDVDYVKIYLTAEVGIRSYYHPAQVQQAVEEAVRRLLAFDTVDFRMTLYLSKFYQAIEAVEGIQYVNISEFCRARPGSQPASGEQFCRLGARASHHEDFIVSGKMPLGENEIPRIPNDPVDPQAYARGIRILLLETDRP